MVGFKRGVEFLELVTLPGGEFNFIGRGQRQSFGYASGVLAFVTAAAYLEDSRYLRLARNIFDLLASFQGTDGSIPLVARRDQPAFFGTPDVHTRHRMGWFSYNNYFDYTPFAAALLQISSGIIQEYFPNFDRIVGGADRRDVDVNIDNIRIVRRGIYAAVVRPPIGCLASSQPFPFIECDGEYPLPCFGGEDDPDGLFSWRDLPLPYLRLGNGEEVPILDSFDARWLDHDSFLVESSVGRVLRTFEFGQEFIGISDQIRISRSFRDVELVTNRLLLPTGARQLTPYSLVTGGLLIHSDIKLEMAPRKRRCVLGELTEFNASILMASVVTREVQTRVRIIFGAGSRA